MAPPDTNINRFELNIPPVSATNDNATSKVSNRQQEAGLDTSVSPSSIPPPSSKESFSNEIATVQENINSSTKQLAQEKQEAETKVLDKVNPLGLNIEDTYGQEDK